MKKALKITGNILLWLFVVLAAFIMIVTVVSTFSNKGEKGVPALFGKNMIAVQSDSMVPVFKKGDMLISASFKDPQEKRMLQVGDVITFRADIDGDGAENEFKSHRIIDVVDGSNQSLVGADADVLKTTPVYYITKGDHNEIKDADPVYYSKVVSVWHDGETCLGGLGSVSDFLRSSVGFLVVIVIPCALFFAYELYRLIRVILDVKRQKAAEAPNGTAIPLDEEEIKRRAVEEYIRSQQEKEQENHSDSNDAQ